MSLGHRQSCESKNARFRSQARGKRWFASRLQRSIPATSGMSLDVQENNAASNSRPRLCRRSSKGEAARRRRGLGQAPESWYRSRWVSRGICPCPSGDAIPQTEVAEYGGSGRDRSSLHYGVGISSERSSNPGWRNYSDCRRRGSCGTSSHTDCELEEGARDRRGHQFRFHSGYRGGSQYQKRRPSSESPGTDCGKRRECCL